MGRIEHFTFQKAELNVPKGELSSLEVNLVDELPGWGNDDGFRFLQLTEGTGCDTVCHQLLQNREQERSLGRKKAHLKLCPHANLQASS